MTTPAVTQWFSEAPVNIGLYESVAEHNNIRFAHFDMAWNGQMWIWEYSGEICSNQDRIWRGRVDKPV